jgi:hypothetical protein
MGYIARKKTPQKLKTELPYEQQLDTYPKKLRVVC